MSVNECVFMGNLGADPDLRYLPDGREVVNISIACTEKYRDKTTNEIKENTEWIRAVCFGKRAKSIAGYFTKGSQIYIRSKSRTRKYQHADGTDRWTTEYVIQDFRFCGQKTGGSGDAKAQQQASAYDRGASASKADNNGDQNQPPVSAYQGAYDDFSDDILFASLNSLIKYHLI